MSASPTLTKASHSRKHPQAVFETVFAFPPNRETLGGTAYLIVDSDSSANRHNILVDCPAFNETNQAFIDSHGGLQTLVISHRGGMAQVKEWQNAFGASVLIQEQEAYLLPGIEVETFHRDRTLTPTNRIFWTPGHSPGSSCLYHSSYGGVLFTGRHLLPNKAGEPRPLKLSKTFHWPRQLKYSQQILSDFTSETLSTICPGASTGFLRGEKKIDDAYRKLSTANWDDLSQCKPML
ncbi:MAG: MBL fold metallo-hydrolase [Cyanobacteria bacterium J06632_3]